MDDEKIVALYIQRSQQAILETRKKYGAYCRVIARRILANLRDVEECENDAYLAAWNTIPPQIPRKLSIFLGRIIRNIALDKHSYNTAKKKK
ncbi:sigma factor [Lysinibacillus boronitolerans]|uniref:sigma factor n=1 Tax=Lysinibacillus boronitolerans TaxID=309788 RepID=UPI000318F133|nr:sigma factor [Lysinibacillus boronitolerans]